MSSPSTRPPNPGDDAVSPIWLVVRFMVSAPLLPAGSDEGGVAAVFRGPGVRATTMPDGNDREHEGHAAAGVPWHPACRLGGRREADPCLPESGVQGCSVNWNC